MKSPRKASFLYMAALFATPILTGCGGDTVSTKDPAAETKAGQKEIAKSEEDTEEAAIKNAAEEAMMSAEKSIDRPAAETAEGSAKQQ